MIKEKFERITLENDAFLNFAVNQEKRRDTTFKNSVDSNSMSKETCGPRSGTMYGTCKYINKK